MTQQKNGEKSEAKNPLEFYQTLREQIPKQLNRETLTPLSLPDLGSFADVLKTGIGIGLATWILLWIILANISSVQSPGNTASNLGVFAMCAFWCAPFFSLLFKKTNRTRFCKWNAYPATRQIVACMAFTFVLGNVVRENVLPLLHPQNQQSVKGDKKDLKQDLFGNRNQSIPSHLPFASLTKTQVYLLGWPICFISLFVLMITLSGASKRRQRQGNQKINNPGVPPVKQGSFSLWLGESTGKLSKLWHPANLAAHQHIGLTLPEACQNIAILGAIGSGKTTRAMHPLLMQLLDQDCGGLIFDIKGDFKKSVLSFAALANKKPILIGVHQKPLNLLQGLSPEIAASFLKSALLLAGSGKADSFWVDTSVEVCRNTLGILSFLPQHYHLNSLYLYLFDQEFQKEIKYQLTSGKIHPDQERLFKIYQHYLDSIFAGFEEKIRSGVLANISQILSPFQHPDLVDTFCKAAIPESIFEKPIIDSELTEETAQDKPQKPLSENAMEDLLNGTIYVVDMPLARWGLAGKVIYTLIKLRFFNLMQQRALHPEWDQLRPVFFMCDEYQEIVSCNKDGLSDLNFWDKSRSSQTIGIISAQSISSFYAAIGDRDLVHALLQNFRQKLVFRIEDDWTIQYCNRILGQVETQKIIDSISSGTSSGKESNSSGQSLHYQQKDVIDGQLFRMMKPNQVLALLSVNGAAADDILTVRPLFAPEREVISNSEA